MAAIVNGKNGVTFLALSALVVLAGFGAIVYTIHEGYEPTFKLGGAEVSLQKRFETPKTKVDEINEHNTLEY